MRFFTWFIKQSLYTLYNYFIYLLPSLSCNILPSKTISTTLSSKKHYPTSLRDQVSFVIFISKKVPCLLENYCKKSLVIPISSVKRSVSVDSKIKEVSPDSESVFTKKISTNRSVSKNLWIFSIASSRCWKSQKMIDFLRCDPIVAIALWSNWDLLRPMTLRLDSHAWRQRCSICSIMGSLIISENRDSVIPKPIDKQVKISSLVNSKKFMMISIVLRKENLRYKHLWVLYSTKS